MEKRFTLVAITANGVQRLRDFSDFHMAESQALLEANDVIRDKVDDPITIRVNDEWMPHPERCIFEIKITPPQRMLKAGIHWPDTHDQVEVFTREEAAMGGMMIEGTFRARIVSTDCPGFDGEGKAIWITTKQGFEAFVNIEDIAQLSIVG